MTCISEKSPGPFGDEAETIGALGHKPNTGATFTNFGAGCGFGVAIGTKDEHGRTTAVLLTLEDTEEIRQQLNKWYGAKAKLSEVKHG